MKQYKLLVTILAIVALLLSGWSIYGLTSDQPNIVGSSLNLLYFLTLFIVFLCTRITTGFAGKIEPINALLSIAIIASSTYTWIFPSELLVFGNYTLALLPVLIGTTLMQVVKTDSNFSRIIQMGVGVVVLAMAVCVITGAMGASIYFIIFLGLVAISLFVVGYSIFGKN